jgi:hypothetical protein
MSSLREFYTLSKGSTLCGQARSVSDIILAGTQGKLILHIRRGCAPDPHPDELVWKPRYLAQSRHIS